MPVRATKRGAERTSLDGARADVLVCGASFGGLAVARELARGAPRRLDVLVVDRYEVGERATSACAAPTPWLHAMGVASAIRQELPHMTFATPHGRVRYRLPWSWSSFDYRELSRALWAQAGDARFETAKVEGRAPGAGADGEVAVVTDRGTLRAGLVVDALGWRRVLADPHVQPPDAPLSRGLEVHPHRAEPAGDALDVWVERDLVRRGYGWRVPAGGEARIGVGSYDAARSRAGADGGARRTAGGGGGALAGQLVPAPPARRDRGRGVLRGRQRRAVLPAFRGGHPHGLLLRDRVRAGAAARAGRRRRPRRGARALRAPSTTPTRPPSAARCASSGCCPRCRPGC